MILNNNEKVLLDLLKSSIHGTDCKINNDSIDWNIIFNLADGHAVNLLVFDELYKYKQFIPVEVYNKWFYIAGRKITNQENLLKIQKKLTCLLDDNGYKYAIIKGFSAANYYNKPNLREIGDIDFYVAKEDIKKISELIKSNGFSLYGRSSNDIHISYKVDNYELEMHYCVSILPDNDCGDYIRTYFEEYALNTKICNYNQYEFSVLNPICQIISLILHIVTHLQQGGIGLRHFCDLAVFLNSDDFYKNYDEILTVLRKCGLLDSATVFSKICSMYLGTKEYDFMLNADEELCALLFRDVLNSGNFGKLSENEYYGSGLLTNNTSGGFFDKLSLFCKSSWKPCRESKVLLLIAPAYIGIRYIFRSICGKRPKVNFIKLIKKSYYRKDLYKQLNFFKER